MAKRINLDEDPRNANWLREVRRMKEVKVSKSVSFLYQLARVANDCQKLSSGDPKKIGRRVGNKIMGRTIISRVWLGGKR